MKNYAFYLPQFHECEENNHFWGDGFTDWTTTRNAKPIFSGHRQPRTPGELGYYNLLSRDTINQQAELARSHGIDGFAIYYYWFDRDVRALDGPLKILRADPTIEIDYFLSWVNADWTKSWVGDNETTIFRQTYKEENYPQFFEELCEYFEDPRYVKVDGRPVLYVHNPGRFDPEKFKSIGNEIAASHGYESIYWIAPLAHTSKSTQHLFDALVGYPPGDMNLHSGENNRLRAVWNLKAVLRKVLPDWAYRSKFVFKNLAVFSYPDYAEKYKRLIDRNFSSHDNYVPCIMPNWDNTPRYRERGFLFDEGSADAFEDLLKYAGSRSHVDTPFLLIKAWNEWAEGNFLEPDSQSGFSYLNAVKNAAVALEEPPDAVL